MAEARTGLRAALGDRKQEGGEAEGQQEGEAGERGQGGVRADEGGDQ